MTVFVGLVKPLELALKSSILWRLKKEYLHELVEFSEGVYKICKTLANAENRVHDLWGATMSSKEPTNNIPLPHFSQREKIRKGLGYGGPPQSLACTLKAAVTHFLGAVPRSLLAAPQYIQAGKVSPLHIYNFKKVCQERIEFNISLAFLQGRDPIDENENPRVKN